MRDGLASRAAELVAELGSAFLCAELAVMPTARHADYLGAWLEVLKADIRAMFQAASLASKAADFVMGRDASKGGPKSDSPPGPPVPAIHGESAKRVPI